MKLFYIQDLIDFLRGKTKEKKILPSDYYIFTKRKLENSYERVLNIYFSSGEGIANRIKRLFSAMRLYYGKYDTIDLHWPLKEMSHSSFKELFEFKSFERINELNHSIFIDKGFCKGVNWRLLIKPEELAHDFSKAYPQDNKSIPCIDFEYNRIPEDIRDLYKHYFLSLRPAEKVQKLIDSVILPEKCISVHIRHNEDWKHWNRWDEGDIPRFIEIMKPYDDETYFFLACCDSNVRNVILEEFAGRIIELPNKKFNENSNLQDIAELYLLSKNKILIGTYGSTFSEVAWWLSGCSQEVKIIGSYDKWKNNGHPYKKVH